MKIYAEVQPKDLGRVMYRINGELKKYAPKDIEFIQNPDKADMQILDVIGPGSFNYLYKDKYILLQHCLITANMPSAEYLQEKLSKALLVAGYLDLKGFLTFDNYNYLRIPWGADPKIFYPLGSEKIYSILSTGHIAYTECIDCAYDAVKNSGTEMIHVGHNFNFGKGFIHYENITDDQLNALYNKCYFVIGMRKIEGFELPIIEGLLAGTRGICLDEEIYHYWYGDLVEYIKDGTFEYISQQIYDLLHSQYRPVTKEEIEFVKQKFSWRTIMTEFWKRAKEVI